MRFQKLELLCVIVSTIFTAPFLPILAALRAFCWLKQLAAFFNPFRPRSKAREASRGTERPAKLPWGAKIIDRRGGTGNGIVCGR